MIRVLEDAGGGRIRDAATKNLVSSSEVVDAMRDYLAGVARATLPFLELLCKDNSENKPI